MLKFFGLHDHEEPKEKRRKKRKHSSSRHTSKPTPVTHHAHPSQSVANISYPPPLPPQASAISIHQRPSTGYTHHGHSLSVPHHPIYGPSPQHPPQHAHPYGSAPTHHYPNQSSISFAASPPKPPRSKEGIMHSYVHRVDHAHPAAKSQSNLRDQLTSDAGKSSSKLATKTSQYFEQSLLCKKSTQVLNQGAALCDIMCSKLDAVLTSIDGEKYTGNDPDLEAHAESLAYAAHAPASPEKIPKGLTPHTVHSIDENGTSQFSKVWLYANSRLPPHLPPFKVYVFLLSKR